MIRLALILLLAAGQARATNDGWPALYDVTGVAASDVLNIRAEPDAQSEILGHLRHDAAGIEVIRMADDADWGLVNSGEGPGWVAMRYLARRPDQLDYIYPEFTSCGGTEPFWNLSRANGAITYDLMLEEYPEKTEPMIFEKTSIGHRHRYSFRTETLVGVISREECNDGMSDLEFGLELNLILLDQNVHLQGCCSIQPPLE